MNRGSNRLPAADDSRSREAACIVHDLCGLDRLEPPLPVGFLTCDERYGFGHEFRQHGFVPPDERTTVDDDAFNRAPLTRRGSRHFHGTFLHVERPGSHLPEVPAR